MNVENRLELLEHTVVALLNAVHVHGSPALSKECHGILSRHLSAIDQEADGFARAVFQGSGYHTDLKRQLDLAPTRPKQKDTQWVEVDTHQLIKNLLTPNVLKGATGEWDIKDDIEKAPVLESIDPTELRPGIYRSSELYLYEVVLVTDIKHSRYKAKALWILESKQVKEVAFWTYFPHEGGWLYHRVSGGFTKEELRNSLTRLAMDCGHIPE